VDAFPVRLAVAKLPDVPLSVRHHHLAQPMGAVVIDRPAVHNPILKLDAQLAHWMAVDELSLQDASFGQQDVSDAVDVPDGHYALLKQEAVFAVLSLHHLQKSIFFLAFLALVGFLGGLFAREFSSPLFLDPIQL
jgi:hypothetical protein